MDENKLIKALMDQGMTWAMAKHIANQVGAGTAVKAGIGAKLGGLASKLKGFSPMKALGKVKDAYYGSSLPKLANVGLGAFQGLTNLQEGMNLMQNMQESNDTISNIKNLAYNNPTIYSQMDPASKKTLRQIQSGSYIGNDWKNFAGGTVAGLPQALGAAALGALVGGPTGAIINGIGSLSKSGMRGMERSMPKLDALYNQLLEADADYRSMRRPSNLRTAGLQTRFMNQLY